MFTESRNSDGTDPLINLLPLVEDSMQAYPPPTSLPSAPAAPAAAAATAASANYNTNSAERTSVLNSTPPTSSHTPTTTTTTSATSLSTYCRVVLIISALVAINVLLLVALALIAVHYPKFSSPGILAFTFGLRHAVDADHIAAIDNVSRKLISDGKTPLLVGFYFSIGHSTVVTLLCGGVAFGSTWLRQHLDNVKSIGAIIGTSVSSLVLLIVAGMNIVVAWRLVVSWRKISAAKRRKLERERGHDLYRPLLSSSSSSSSTGPQSSYVDPTSGLSFVMGSTHLHDDGAPEHSHMIVIDSAGRAAVAEEDENSSTLGGCFTRCCPHLFGAVDAQWKMYPIGFLFGLGFDTASEVALLGLTAMNASAIPSSYILVLPLLFASGMSLIDTIDGILMLYAYSWASVDRRRRIFFNLYLTTVSAFIAIVVAFTEILGLLSSEMGWIDGWFWGTVASINNHFEYVGYSILGFFALSMVVAAVSFKWCVGNGKEEVEEEVEQVIESSNNQNDQNTELVEDEENKAGTKYEGETKSRMGEHSEPNIPVKIATRAQEADYLRKRMLAMARGNVQAIDI